MNFKKMLSIILVAVLCLTLFSGCGEEKGADASLSTTTTNQSDTATGKSITIVGGNDKTGFYETLKKGGEEAAKKYGFTLNYIGIDDAENSDIATYINKLEEALNSGTSGVVVTPMGGSYSEIFSKFYDEAIPVVQIDNISEDDIEDLESKNKNPIAATVLTDYKQAGSLCAEKMFEAVKEDIKKSQDTYVIGIIERDEEESDEQKSNGFTEKFTELADADNNTKGKYLIKTETETNISDSFDELIADKVKGVFITHPSIADKISDVVASEKEKYKDITFCGFDSGAKQLKWLESEDSGKFIGGIAQDAYNLGYNAVEQCIFSIQGKELKPYIEIEGHWYDKTNVDKMKQDKFVFEK